MITTATSLSYAFPGHSGKKFHFFFVPRATEDASATTPGGLGAANSLPKTEPRHTPPGAALSFSQSSYLSSPSLYHVPGALWLWLSLSFWLWLWLAVSLTHTHAHTRTWTPPTPLGARPPALRSPSPRALCPRPASSEPALPEPVLRKARSRGAEESARPGLAGRQACGGPEMGLRLRPGVGTGGDWPVPRVSRSLRPAPAAGTHRLAGLSRGSRLGRGPRGSRKPLGTEVICCLATDTRGRGGVGRTYQ